MHGRAVARDPVRLSWTRRWIVYGVGAGLWLTGVLWLVYHYFLQRQTEFGVQPHPLEFWWRAGHGLFGFASLWTFGLLWGVHVAGGWKSRRRRWSGGAQFALLAWLIVTGYLLYYVGSDDWQRAVAIAHWSVGLGLPAAFVVHRFARVTRPWARTSGTIRRD
jgi:hypothetical protein